MLRRYTPGKNIRYSLEIRDSVVSKLERSSFRSFVSFMNAVCNLDRVSNLIDIDPDEVYVYALVCLKIAKELERSSLEFEDLDKEVKIGVKRLKEIYRTILTTLKFDVAVVTPCSFYINNHKKLSRINHSKLNLLCGIALFDSRLLGQDYTLVYEAIAALMCFRFPQNVVSQTIAYFILDKLHNTDLTESKSRDLYLPKFKKMYVNFAKGKLVTLVSEEQYKDDFTLDFTERLDLGSEVSSGKYGSVHKLGENVVKVWKKYSYEEEKLHELAILRKQTKGMVKLVKIVVTPTDYYPVLQYYKYTLHKVDYLDAKETIKSMVSTIKTLNDLGIMHVDIKPNNWVYDTEPHLIDFGSSSILPSYGTYVGWDISHHIPPELGEDYKDIDHKKAEIYSLGFTIDWLFGGKDSILDDLTKSMTRLKPNKRPSYRQILTHPFLR